MTFPLLIAFAILLFSASVLFIGRLRFLDEEPWHSNWLSFAGGVAIAYCFAYLLPKLAKLQPYLEASTDGGLLGYLEHHIYLVATFALVIYLGLSCAADYLVKIPLEDKRMHALRDFLAHTDVVGAAAYFLLLGYLLSEITYWNALILFIVGMALHVLGLAHVFRERYPARYDGRIRWSFAAAVLVGGVIGWATQVSELVFALFVAFLAGGIIPSALRDELPQRSKLRFWPFFLGVTLFVALALVIEVIEKK